jgi:hypothetical protein
VADEGRGEIDIAADREAVWSVVADVASYPQWAKDVRHAEVLEVDDEGRPAVAEYRAGAYGVTIGYVVRYRYELPDAVGWELVRSSELRRMDGEYRCTERAGAGAGSALTHVTYRLSVDLRIPVLPMLKRRAEKLIIRTALQDLRARVQDLAGSDGAS